jgi:hypothetical protein
MLDFFSSGDRNCSPSAAHALAAETRDWGLEENDSGIAEGLSEPAD